MMFSKAMYSTVTAFFLVVVGLQRQGVAESLSSIRRQVSNERLNPSENKAFLENVVGEKTGEKAMRNGRQPTRELSWEEHHKEWEHEAPTYTGKGKGAGWLFHKKPPPDHDCPEPPSPVDWKEGEVFKAGKGHEPRGKGGKGSPKQDRDLSVVFEEEQDSWLAGKGKGKGASKGNLIWGKGGKGSKGAKGKGKGKGKGSIGGKGAKGKGKGKGKGCPHVPTVAPTPPNPGFFPTNEPTTSADMADSLFDGYYYEDNEDGGQDSIRDEEPISESPSPSPSKSPTPNPTRQTRAKETPQATPIVTPPETPQEDVEVTSQPTVQEIPAMPDAPETRKKTESDTQSTQTSESEKPGDDNSSGGASPGVVAAAVCCSAGFFALTAFVVFRRRRRAREDKGDDISDLNTIDNTLDGGTTGAAEAETNSHLSFMKKLISEDNSLRDEAQLSDGTLGAASNSSTSPLMCGPDDEAHFASPDEEEI